MDTAQYKYLLALDKYILVDQERILDLRLDLNTLGDIRWMLSAPADEDQVFLINIKESKKKSYSISLHNQDNNTKLGLVRIDFNSRHRNPETILDTVPKEFRPYAGLYLDDSAGHIHYHVEGYSSLAWAMPIDVDKFPVKKIGNLDDLAQTIKAFCEVVNLRTNLEFIYNLRLL